MPAWLAPVIVSGVQMGIGALQRAKARKEREKALDSFEKDIPSATKEQLQLARERATLRGLPGEDITRSRLESEVAQTLEAPVDTASDLLGLYAKAMGQKGDYLTQLREKGAAFQAQNEVALYGALSNYANAEEGLYQHRRDKVMADLGYATDLATGGAANLASGAQGMFSTFANEWMVNQMNEMFGAEDTPATTPPGTTTTTPGTPLNINRANQMWNNTKPSTNWGTNYPANNVNNNLLPYDKTLFSAPGFFNPNLRYRGATPQQPTKNNTFPEYWNNF